MRKNLSIISFCGHNPPWELLNPSQERVKGLSTVRKSKSVGILQRLRDNRLKLISDLTRRNLLINQICQSWIRFQYATIKVKKSVNALIVLQFFCWCKKRQCLRTKNIRNTNKLLFPFIEAKPFSKCWWILLRWYLQTKRVDSSFYINKYDKTSKLNSSYWPI
jgi:hypothetical protein